nr:unnamed protein product [Callosobruchus analis]
MLKILRRQKIYTETVSTLEEIKITSTQQANEVYQNEANVIRLRHERFRSFSDLYFKNSQTIPSCVIVLNDYTQTERNLLISKSRFICSTSFVPFFHQIPCKNTPGILHGLSRFSPTKLECEQCSIIEQFPIFSNILKHNYQKKHSLGYLACRIHTPKKVGRKIADIEEIIAVVESDNALIEETPNEVEQPASAEREVLLLNPLLLEMRSRRSKQRISDSEHKKIARITILYVLAFFALALITFFVTYLA